MGEQREILDGVAFEAFAQIVDRHNEAEFSQDVDATMATVCGRPYYTFEPMGWVIRDTQTLREFYTAILPMLLRLRPIGESKARTFVGDAGIVLWEQSLQYTHADGAVTPINLAAFIVRDVESGLIKGEHSYTDAALAEIFRSWVSADLQARLKS